MIPHSNGARTQFEQLRMPNTNLSRPTTAAAAPAPAVRGAPMLLSAPCFFFESAHAGGVTPSAPYATRIRSASYFVALLAAQRDSLTHTALAQTAGTNARPPWPPGCERMHAEESGQLDVLLINKTHHCAVAPGECRPISRRSGAHRARGAHTLLRRLLNSSSSFRVERFNKLLCHCSMLASDLGAVRAPLRAPKWVGSMRGVGFPSNRRKLFALQSSGCCQCGSCIFTCILSLFHYVCVAESRLALRTLRLGCGGESWAAVTGGLDRLVPLLRAHGGGTSRR